MENNIKKLINETVFKIITKASEKVPSLTEKHNKKLHFIPLKYRVFGGLLQSMNIQFGNFIEELMKNLILNEEKYELIEELSGKKSNSFTLSEKNEQIIDAYISNCQTNYDMSISKFKELETLLEDLILDQDKKLNKFTHDIDLLFRNKENGIIYYLEIKYNDDHDTGKYVDINRKLIKTYAYLSKYFNIKNKSEIVPILFFFNNKKMKGNIYLPENNIVKRGKKFFDEFLSIKYEDVDNYLKNLSESSQVIEMFNNLYHKTVKKNLVIFLIYFYLIYKV